MPNISSSELIAQFQTALREGWGYIYGASGEIWTQAQQNAASREQTKKYGGHRSQRYGVWRCHVENRQRMDALGRTERRGLRRESLQIKSQAPNGTCCKEIWQKVGRKKCSTNKPTQSAGLKREKRK